MSSEHSISWSLVGSLTALILAMASALTFDPSGTAIGSLICILMLLKHLGHSEAIMVPFNAASLVGVASLMIGTFLLVLPIDLTNGLWLHLFVFIRSVTLFAAGVMITSWALVQRDLELNPFMFVTTIYLTANLLLSICVLGLLMFDYLSGHAIIIDNRWMMFIISDVFITLWIFAIFLMIFRRYIPCPTEGGAKA